MTATETRTARDDLRGLKITTETVAENLRGMVEDGWFEGVDPSRVETLLENIETLEAKARGEGE